MMESQDRPIPVWMPPALFAGLALLLYLLPHASTEAMEIHSAITGALRAGNNWGRQALVGNTDYPALQSLALLVCESIAAPIRLSGPRLLCALAQAWMLTTLLRLMLHTGHWKLAWLPIAAAGILPALRVSMASLDPNWVVAVPAAEILYHLVLWRETKNLRSMIVASASCGILCLCGLAGLAVGCCTALMLYVMARGEFLSEKRSTGGLRTLLWSSAAYAMALWLLWNWLVMDDLLFGLRDLFARLGSLKGSSFSMSLFTANPLSVSIVAFLSPLAILCFKGDSRSIPQWLALQIILLIGFSALSNCLQIPATGVAPLATVVVLGTLILCCISGFAHPVSRQSCLIALACCIFITFRAASITGHSLDSAPIRSSLPSREELTSYIDQYWPESRTMLYGLKLPAAYPDPIERRFVARLDFQQEELLTQETDEQLHILVPPPDGRFYPRERSVLADIHANGREWLLLEKQWPSGCQLWRVVPPPKNESRLQFLQ